VSDKGPDDAVRACACADYNAQISAQTPDIIPFDDAWQEVLSLIERTYLTA
jgi:hypothetical protein